MWINNAIIADVDRIARIFYIGMDRAKQWNEHRRGDEPRLMCGWVWSARVGGEEQHGIRTQTAAYIDAWYRLVQHKAAPSVHRARLRVVQNKRSAA